MNREKLLKNMTDQVKEAQLKLGYAKETVRLYYPMDSLNTILGSNAKDDQEMLALLRKAFEEKSSLGELHFHSHAGRVEISIPPEGSQWVHEQVETPAFLKDLIQLFQEHHACTLEEICQVFENHGQRDPILIMRSTSKIPPSTNIIIVSIWRWDILFIIVLQRVIIKQCFEIKNYL